MLTLPDICTLCGLRWWPAYRLARAGAWEGRLESIAGRRTWVFTRRSVLVWLKQQNARPARAERSEHHDRAVQERRRASA